MRESFSWIDGIYGRNGFSTVQLLRFYFQIALMDAGYLKLGFNYYPYPCLPSAALALFAEVFAAVLEQGKLVAE
ncbi:hypothetical protein A7P85_07190 [Eikenella corrodens]|uniref:Uncharacterized protein n=1 Tax=Eikenella corrodens TaxID=539 RepID=A0A1A9RD53_EIKCO|nr:hypothetical protein A7P85_07190 [Eikenella corrodens]OAM23422.1 hypothetical protein A7P92_07525 [Eikenella corrodens]